MGRAPEKAEVEELRRERRMVDAAELITACSDYLLEFLTSAFSLLPSDFSGARPLPRPTIKNESADRRLRLCASG
jgi:hypothetical protein